MYQPHVTVARLKACLVTKGYTQTYGVDDFEAFSPVAKSNSICILIFVVINLNQPLSQPNVKNAFLYGDLQEEVYMEQPLGFDAQGAKNKVYKLK